MKIENILTEKTIEAIKKLYDQSISPNQIVFQKTKPEFEGDLTLLVFPLIKASKKSPEETANAIGEYLKANTSFNLAAGSLKKCVTAFNVVKGFLNLAIDDEYWSNYLIHNKPYEIAPLSNPETVMVEFSSPNTNKPLHLGHIRNNLLGASISSIIKASGNKNAYNSSNKAQPVVNTEKIINMNPDIIVLLAPFHDGKTAELNEIKKLWKTLPINAAKQNNIYAVDKLYAGIPSQRVEFFINDFRKILEDVRNK